MVIRFDIVEIGKDPSCSFSTYKSVLTVTGTMNIVARGVHASHYSGARYSKDHYGKGAVFQLRLSARGHEIRHEHRTE